jgi:hypothetical protein
MGVTHQGPARCPCFWILRAVLPADLPPLLSAYPCGARPTCADVVKTSSSRSPALFRLPACCSGGALLR